MDVIENLLMAVEQQFPNVVLKYEANKNMTLESLKASLLDVENRRKEMKDRNSEGTVLVVDKKKEDETRKNVMCYKCGGKGHVIADCKSTNWICYKCGKMTNSHNASTCQADEQVQNVCG